MLPRGAVSAGSVELILAYNGGDLGVVVVERKVIVIVCEEGGDRWWLVVHVGDCDEALEEVGAFVGIGNLRARALGLAPMSSPVRRIVTVVSIVDIPAHMGHVCCV